MKDATGGRRRLLQSFFRSTAAQDLAEYGIGLAILGSGVAAIAFTIRADIVALWAEAARFLVKFAAIVGGG